MAYLLKTQSGSAGKKSMLIGTLSMVLIIWVTICPAQQPDPPGEPLPPGGPLPPEHEDFLSPAGPPPGAPHPPPHEDIDRPSELMEESRDWDQRTEHWERRRGRRRPPRDMRGGGAMVNWQRLDQRFQRNRVKFEQIEIKNQELMEQLTEAKQRYHPDRIDTGTLLVRRKIGQLLAELHGLDNESQELIGESAERLILVLRTRRMWEPQLRQQWEEFQSRDQMNIKEKQQTKERFERWLTALERLDEEGQPAFAQVLLGKKLGALAVESVPKDSEATDPEWRNGPPPRGPGEFGPPPHHRRIFGNQLRNRLMGRLRRIEDNQDDLKRSLKHQEREIERLRFLLENQDGEP